MEATHTVYDYKKSAERISEILNASDSEYEEKNSIPDRSLLTFTNGFHVRSSAMFVDIRGSKTMSENISKPALAKIYKAYISELVAVMRGHSKINEIYIEGDCVWGVFDASYKKDLDELIEVAARASSLIDMLNLKLSKKSYPNISVGIGLSYGSSLYIKAGHKGSGINEVVWVGELIGEAAKLCSYGSRTANDQRIMASNVFKYNLKESYQAFFSWNTQRDCWHAAIHMPDMSKWAQNNA